MAPSLHPPLHHIPPDKCACAYYVHNVYVLVLNSRGSSLCQRLFSQELAYWLQKGTIITAGTCTHGGQLQLTLTNYLARFTIPIMTFPVRLQNMNFKGHFITFDNLHQGFRAKLPLQQTINQGILRFVCAKEACKCPKMEGTLSAVTAVAYNA